MRYQLDFTIKSGTFSPSVTGANVSATGQQVFTAWQPSTWPSAPAGSPDQFAELLKGIFEESILGEVRNVIDDIRKSNGTLANRGHVVAIALMCALDAISSYGYRGKRSGKFITDNFPAAYHPYADQIYELFRLSLIHSWNLFEASIYADDSPIRTDGATIAFGLLNFFDALVQGTENFLTSLLTNDQLLTNSIHRYEELRATARP
jgi:hypothetical protein